MERTNGLVYWRWDKWHKTLKRGWRDRVYQCQILLGFIAWRLFKVKWKTLKALHRGLRIGTHIGNPCCSYKWSADGEGRRDKLGGYHNSWQWRSRCGSKGNIYTKFQTQSQQDLLNWMDAQVKQGGSNKGAERERGFSTHSFFISPWNKTFSVNKTMEETHVGVSLCKYAFLIKINKS